MPERSAVHELRLRGYRREDLDALFRMDERCFEAAFRFSNATMKKFAEARYARVVIGELGEELAGFCIVHLQRVEGALAGYVVTLDVAPEWRRAGVATALMTRAEQEAAAEGCAEIFLHVFMGNESAVRFYERSGYELAGRARGFYGRGLDGLLYRKELTDDDSSLAS